MAISVRQLSDAVTYALVSAWNLFRGSSGQVGSSFHADVTSTTSGDNYFSAASTALQVSLANATDLPSCIALMNQIATVARIHFADGISTNKYSAGANKIPDTVNAALLPALYTATGVTVTDTAQVVANANLLKSTINAHFTQAAPSAVHFNNDGTNTIATANATVLADSITLLNAIKTAINAHITNAPAGSSMINIIAP